MANHVDMNAAGRKRLRVWTEFLTPAELREKRVVDLLARSQCGIFIQTRQDQLGSDLADTVATLADAGVPDVGLWLLLDSRAGYWPSERNAAAVLQFTREIVDARLRATWLAIDLEPPLWQARQSRLRSSLQNLDRRRFDSAAGIFRELISVAHGAGLQVLCAAHGYLAEDLWVRRPALQDMHEAPVLGLPWDVISVMLYGSMIGAPAADARRWMFETASLLAPHARGASIGLTGTGVLGNEPHYTSPDDLAQDAAVLKAAGVTDFAVYSLEGVVAAGRPEAWFEAVQAVEPRVPPPSAWARRERWRGRAAALLVAAIRSVWRGSGERRFKRARAGCVRG